MGRTLGINDDYWHGIIAFVVFCATAGITTYLFQYVIANQLVTVLFSMFMGVMVTLLLQALNEAIQFLDNELLRWYGTLYQAQENSRRDWKYFLYGIFLAMTIYPVFLLTVCWR